MFWNNLVKLCSEKNISPSALTKLLGLSTVSATKWKKGAIPRDTTLKKIADYFGVNVTDLLSDNEKKPVHVDELQQGNLSHESRILLSAYSKATDDDRRVLWALLDKYMTPNEKEYFSQSEQTDHVG